MKITKSLGWLRDLPDFRDYTPDMRNVPISKKAAGQKRSIAEMLAEVGWGKALKGKLPSTTDLREWCSPIEQQGEIGSCTAHAGVGLLEYFERRAFGKHLDASRLFLYKVTRNLMKRKGDTGAECRPTMGAMVLFGVPPEEYYPYVEKDFDQEPAAFCYSFAQNFQAISYYRLDGPGVSAKDALHNIKSALASGLPSMFGTTVYTSLDDSDHNGGCIPFPTKGEAVTGGHAMMVVGYDDKKKITNKRKDGLTTTGAFLVRNSWGTEWGEEGYGWIPYEYVLRGLAVDWWSLIRNEWVETEQFKYEE
jgi:C1A family cysteine protease